MFWKALKTLLVMTVLSAGAFTIGSVAQTAGVVVAVEVFLFLASSYAIFCLISPPRHGACLANLAGGYRAVGPGVHLLGCPGEWVDRVVDLRKFEITFIAKPDTAGRDAAAMRVVVGCEPSVPYLPEYIRFEEAERKYAVQSRIEGLLTRLGHLCGSFDAIYAGGADISAKIMLLYKNDSAGGMSLEEYYGLKVNYVIFPDITGPQIVRDAAALKWVAEEDVKTLQIKVRGYEDQIDVMVANEPSLSRSQARDTLLAITGAIPQTTLNRRIETGPELAKTIKHFSKIFKGGRS